MLAVLGSTGVTALLSVSVRELVEHGLDRVLCLPRSGVAHVVMLEIRVHHFTRLRSWSFPLRKACSRKYSAINAPQSGNCEYRPKKQCFGQT
jgi:hypothetical protein